MNWDRPTPLLHQTAHGKRLLTAYTSRNNPLELAWRTPVLQHWRYLGPDIIDLPLDAIASTILYDFNLRYIVLDYWQMPPGWERDATEQWVAAALPKAIPIYSDGRLIVYQSPPKQNTVPYLTLGNGWGQRQASESGAIFRTFVATEDSQPELFLHHPQERTLTLEITAASEVPQTLILFANDAAVGKIEVTETYTPLTVRLPQLTSQIAKLRFLSDTSTAPVLISRISLQEL
jgi:hypothetical protein